MKNIVKKTIEEYNMIEEFDKIIIGVSGGHDSMMLLHVLNSLKEEMNFEIVVAHINHGVRGRESDGDEKYVRNISSELGLEFYSHKVNMDEYARLNKMTSEEAGREIRYDFFNKILKKTKAQRIAVAHNRNDQAETLLLRFMRGTGIDGLRGMEYVNGNIIRPILNIERKDIENYCDNMSLEPRVDKTNYMNIYGRNKVRLQLIPFIEKTFNSGIINTLFRTSEIMKNDGDFLKLQTDIELENSLKLKYEKKVILDLDRLKDMHIAMMSRVIRSAIETIDSLKGIERKNIEDVMKLISDGETGKSLDIGGDITVRTRYDEIIIEKEMNSKKIEFIYEIRIGDTIYIPELNMNIKSKVYPKKNLDIDFNNRFLKCFDYDKINSGIYVRNRKNGDKFTPFGMMGHKKLKDFFIDEKIPKEKRDTTPIVLDGEDIVWVVGHRISEDYKIDSSTERVLVLECIGQREDKDEE